MDHPTLTTSRLILRPWREDDLPAFAALNADPRVMEFMPKLLTRDESDAFAARIGNHFDERGFGLWAVEVVDGSPFIGFVGLSVPRFDAHFTPCVEIGWRLAFDHWRKGYATEAARAALQYVFEKHNFTEIVSFTAVLNTRSQAVMQRLGMTRNPQDDFEHPALADGHPLKTHVLYRIRRASLAAK